MTAGIGEHVSKVATTTVEALKSAPIVLALVLFNIIFMFLVAYIVIKSHEHWDREIARWAELANSCLKSSP